MRDTSSKALRFHSIYLENWRNFQSVQVELKDRVFLVGPNASGKSNFLDVFRFLHDIVEVGGGRFQFAVRKRGGVSSLRCLAAKRYPDLAVHVKVSKDIGLPMWEYELRFNQDNRGIPIIKKERISKEGVDIVDRPSKQDKEDPERLTQTYLEQVNVNRDFRDLVDFFASIRYLHIVPQLVREPDRSVGRQNDPFGGDFLEQIARTPDKTRKAWLRRIGGALRVAVPQLKELELWKDKRGTPHLRGKYEHWRPRGAWQTEELFSDGTLRLLGLLWSALSGSGPILLEEPELSLHPEVVRFIPQMFARIQSRTGRQIFISTHSKDLLQDNGIGLDEVLLLQPSTQGTTVKPASEFHEIKTLLEGGLNLVDALMPRTRPADAEQLTLFGSGT